jgi:hypothetical protein
MFLTITVEVHENCTLVKGVKVSTGWSKSLCTRRLQYKKHATVPTQLLIWRWPSQNTFGMWTVLYWTRSSRTQFGVSINIWRLAGDTLNISCNFLYCNHQLHRDFLITPYNRREMSLYYLTCLRSVYTAKNMCVREFRCQMSSMAFSVLLLCALALCARYLFFFHRVTSSCQVSFLLLCSFSLRYSTWK